MVFAAILEFVVVTVKLLVMIALAPLQWTIRFFFPSRKDVSNEVVLITGGGMGMGRQVAIEFAKLGASVCLWDINKDAMKAVAEEIRDMGVEKPVHSYVVDVSKSKEVYKAAGKIKEDVGDVTILINNAGLVNSPDLMDVPDDRVQLLIDVNCTAHLWTIKAFLPAMLEKNHGHICSIASGAGLFGISGLLDYCGSKFAAVGINESLTMQLYCQGKTGVKTTVVCPYFVKTGMFEGAGGRFDWLITPLTTEYASYRIVDAIRTDSHLVLMPRICFAFLVAKALLPVNCLLLLADYFDIAHAMDNFVGRAGKKEKKH